MSGQRISDERLGAIIETSAHERSFGRTTKLDAEDTYALLLDLQDARAEIARLTASYEARLADAYQAVGTLISDMGLSENADCIRIQDVLAYGKTEDGVDLLPWPRDRDALLAERAGVSEAMVERAVNAAHGLVVPWIARDMLEAALTTPIPAPVDREYDGDELKRIAENRVGIDVNSLQTAAAIRSAAKTEGS